MAESYFAIGTSLSGLVNFETYFSEAPNVGRGHRIPLMGPNKSRTASAKARRNGFVTVEGMWESVLDTERVAFIYAIFGSFTVASTQVYVTWIDETGHYSPFLCEIDKPQEPEDYELSANGYFDESFRITITNPILQSATKITTASLTTSERLAYCDTSSGGFTVTMPAANALQANTIVSIQKVSASNTLTIARAGSDTINSGTSVALTANNGRYDFATNGTSAWQSVSVV